MADASDVLEEDHPILCETCLGPNPYIRMTREPHGKACKICERPFTVYRWRPGKDARYKKTELCKTCAKLKNVCQTCVLDLQYGLPVQVRDTALEEHEKVAMPTSEVNRLYMIERHENEVALHGELPYSDSGKAATNGLLKKLARRTPYYARNLPHLCSFFAKGECNRGASCPYRHEMPTTGPLAQQNIKDRYYGQNDPVAAKMLGRSRGPAMAPPPPEDKTITTLWVGGIDEKMSEGELRSLFYTYGDVTAVRLVPQKNCAFVVFLKREQAEDAVNNLYKDCNLHGVPLRVSWGKRQLSGVDPAATPYDPSLPSSFSRLSHPAYGAPPPAAAAASAAPEHKGAAAAASSSSSSSSDIPLSSPPPPLPISVPIAPPPGMRGAPRPYYPSMDPSNMSAKLLS